MEKYKQQQIDVPGAYACSTYICNRVHLVILILSITWGEAGFPFQCFVSSSVPCADIPTHAINNTQCSCKYLDF